MGWLDQIVSPVRRAVWGDEQTVRSALADTKIQPRNKRVAEYHRSRRWVETLETRQLLSDASFAGLNFHLNTANSSVDSELATLFSQGTTASQTSVSYTGNINGFSQTLAGSFTVTATSANTFSISATGLNLSLPNNLVQITNATASFNLTSHGLHRQHLQ